MGEFLDNLKNAADNGEFNSEAAKKIIEISELAEDKLKGVKDAEELEQKVEKRIEDQEIKSVSEEEAVELNSEYEKKMADIKKLDAVTKQLGTLVEIEDMVVLTVGDMFSHVNELKTQLEKQLKDDPMFSDLSKKIGEIENKYKSIIN